MSVPTRRPWWYTSARSGIIAVAALALTAAAMLINIRTVGPDFFNVAVLVAAIAMILVTSTLAIITWRRRGAL